MKIALIDDLEEDRQLLTSYLNTFFSHTYTDIPLSIQNYASGEKFLSTFTRNSYDIIFIDYYMENLNGLETASHIRAKDNSASLIFTTASSDYAIDCYLVKASGYLLKPIFYNRLAETISLLDLEKIKERQFVEFENGNEKIRILLKDIIYCDISGHYTQICTLNSGIRRIRITFSKLADTLSLYPEFLLCYRGCLVNMSQIVRIENEAFVMTDNTRIPFRKKEQASTLKAYSEFLFEKVRNKHI